MKYSKFIFSSLLAAGVCMAFSSCDKDEIIVGSTDSGNFGTSSDNVVFTTDALGQEEGVEYTFSGIGTFNLYAATSQAIKGSCSVTYTYDPKVLEDYNNTNYTDIKAVPASAVELSNGGTVTFKEGEINSTPLTIDIAPGGSMQPDVVYAVPLSFTVNGGQAANGENSMLLFVRDTSGFPGADKTYNGQPAPKLMAVFEVNDRNPLSAMSFTLAGSGKQLFDQVVLFASNINYNAATGQVYLHHNENVQALLDNVNKYIRPLQERGMKVILGILGNHDMSGISTLSALGSKDFAQSVKQTIEGYGLDGVFLDDEYTDYNAAASTTNPLFAPQSYENSSRLAYDIKQAMPDKLVISYKYSGLYKGVAIDGHQPGEFFDYVVNDYWDTANPVDTYPGLRQNQAGTGSWNCSDWSQCIPANGAWTQRFSLEGMRTEGYGIMMVYNLNTDPGFWMTRYILQDLGETSKAFYDEELVYNGVFYGKDY